MIKTKGYVAKSASSKLEHFTFERPEPLENQVEIDVLYCGVCHSDLHQARDEWKNTVYPCVPGHEVVGRVKNIGKKVQQFKIGDMVGVGCMIDSCQQCAPCQAGTEQYCEKGFLATYNGLMKNVDGLINTFGGYSTSLVVREEFVVAIPENLDPAKAAPLLCAGVTTFSPLKHWKIKPGDKVGIIGIGGLGHIATKLAQAMGAEVTIITTSEDKVKDALHLGAQHALISSDKKAMKDHANHFDYLLSTIPETHDAIPYVKLLKLDGVLTIVGCLLPLEKPFNMMECIVGRKSVTGSLIGGIQETKDVLAFCSEHEIAPDIKMIKIDEINKAFDEMKKGEVRYRYVIDMQSLHNEKD